MLLQGDCLDVLPTLADRSVDMVFADLPYGVTHCKWDSQVELSRLWPELLRVGKSNAAFVFTATMRFAWAIISSQPTLFRYDLVWVKSAGTGYANARFRPMVGHENVLVFSRATCNPMSKLRMTYNPQKLPGRPYRQASGRQSINYGTALDRCQITDNPTGARHPLSVMSLASVRGKMHPTQKPVALLEWLIKTYSNPGDIILDPTAGSGTTAVAAIRTGRQYVCIERDPTYFDTMQRRVAEALDPVPAKRPRLARPKSVGQMPLLDSACGCNRPQAAP